MLSSYKYAGEVHPKCFQLQLFIVTGDNFTKYLHLASQFLIPERAVEQPSIQHETDAETLISE